MEEYGELIYEDENIEEQKKSELFNVLLDHEEDLREFKRQFGTEDDCRNRLREWRWPNGFTCDRCGNKKEPYRNRNRKNIYQCKNCGYQASLTAGTIFNKTRLPLTRWFLMIYLIAVTDKKIRLSYFQRLWDTKNYKAVWMMADKIKKALAKSDEYLKLVGLVD
jgi:predicted RNA-binding Zn-ribbon protein involved in translation (DUF1610 family)